MLNSRAPEAMPLAIHTLRALRQTVGLDEPFTGHLDLPMREGAVQLERRNTVIEGIASWTLDQAFDPESRDGPPVASRGGAVRTSEVAACTMPLFVRLRYHLRTGTSAKGPILCEEIARLHGFLRDPLLALDDGRRTAARRLASEGARGHRTGAAGGPPRHLRPAASAAGYQGTNMTTSREQFRQWLEAPEGARLEFKEARRKYDLKKLFQYCVALANEGGGQILFGV